jgi:hypothetical protein
MPKSRRVSWDADSSAFAGMGDSTALAGFLGYPVRIA